MFPRAAVVALTATATIKMQQDVFCTLGMKTPHIITGVDTPNINTLWGRGEGEREGKGGAVSYTHLTLPTMAVV